VYINLAKRTDRNEQIRAELESKDLPFERREGIEHEIGLYGCGLAHLAVLKEAREKGWDSVMVFEDDFEFLVKKDRFEAGMAAIDSLDSWDVILLSYNSFRTQPHSQDFVRIMEAQTTSGYIVHSRFYDRLIEVWQEGLRDLEKTGMGHIYALDQCWKRLQPVHFFYGFSPRFGQQRESWSDIERRLVNYGC
jgi:GR25 family glycosyltransferase involved in LPS biosynthesis